MTKMSVDGFVTGADSAVIVNVVAAESMIESLMYRNWVPGFELGLGWQDLVVERGVLDGEPSAEGSSSSRGSGKRTTEGAEMSWVEAERKGEVAKGRENCVGVRRDEVSSA